MCAVKVIAVSDSAVIQPMETHCMASHSSSGWCQPSRPPLSNHSTYSTNGWITSGPTRPLLRWVSQAAEWSAGAYRFSSFLPPARRRVTIYVKCSTSATLQRRMLLRLLRYSDVFCPTDLDPLHSPCATAHGVQHTASVHSVAWNNHRGEHVCFVLSRKPRKVL
jgi:hypothetical protein